MTKFKAYLTEFKTGRRAREYSEPRSKPISFEEARELIHTKCKNTIQQNGHYFRGIHKVRGDYLLFKSGNTERKSANTSNYYTLLLDNLPNWKKFPKRSKSIICSSGIQKALDYGHVYDVYPYDSATVAVCPKDDLWSCFSDVGTLVGFNSFLDSFFRSEPKSYSEMLLILENDEHFIPRAKSRFNLSPRADSKLEEYDIEGAFADIFDPRSNGFKLYRGFQKITRDVEIWTDGPAILLKTGSYDEI